ncbi:MAG: DUF4829 domain-containing protein [Clostridium chrysemydis]|uniref:DUF4829 domain-containing protein n=1 Tax=Clostridium chrysemydis TaxID=2665504 RepID=UPI003F3D769C
MKGKKLTLITILILGFILILGGTLYFNSSKDKDSKEKNLAVEKFYKSYETKDLNLYNESVIDELKIKGKEDEDLRLAVYDDILSFKVKEIKELKNASLEFNGKTYKKDDIATFEVSYDVDFKKNLTSSTEGSVSTTKIITRKDSNSPWLVAGQEGHGL